MNPVALRYQVGPAEHLAKERLLNAREWKDATRNVWKDALPWAGMCILGIVAGYLAQSLLLMIVFGCVLFARLSVAWEVVKRFEANLSALAQKKIRRHEVLLRVDREGLHEEAEGVRSFAPWPAVQSYAKVADVLLPELRGGLWALIPAVAFLGSGAPSEEEFVELLRARGVPPRSQP